MDYFKNIKRKNAVKIVNYISQFSVVFDTIDFRKRIFTAFLMNEFDNGQLIDLVESISSYVYSEDLVNFIDRLLYFYEN